MPTLRPVPADCRVEYEYPSTRSLRPGGASGDSLRAVELDHENEDVASFLDTLNQRVVIADGAMGTYLHAKGVAPDRCLPGLNLDEPGLIRGIHQEYLDAGAEVLLTNTFLAHRPWLKRFGLEERTREINTRGAHHARSVAGSRAWVAGSVAPVGNLPGGEEERRAAYAEAVKALVEGGVDLLMFETFLDAGDLRTATEAARAVAPLPIVASMTFAGPGGAAIGAEPGAAARALAAAGADVVGVNCIAAGEAAAILPLLSGPGRPVSVRPNAGPPGARSSAEVFAAATARLADAGARLIGGCCGTTPEMIRASSGALTRRQ